MKQFTGRKWLFVVVAILIIACKNDTPGKMFEVSGKISNSTAKKVYLEEVPAGSMQGTIVDSSVVSKTGEYSLKTEQKEFLIYNLRLDHSSYPLALALINDVPKLGLNVDLMKDNNQFVDKYEVQGSPSSKELKAFMEKFNDDLKKMFSLIQQADSLGANNGPDSLINRLTSEQKMLAANLRDFSLTSIKNANNPALVIFELGYYQMTVNDERFGLQPVDIQEVSEILNRLAVQFPTHTGVVAVKQSLDLKMEQIKKSMEPRPAKWVGKQAPDFSLPDVNGKEVKLSSFKGKYVLVDFWASWCGPCRTENPNVVKAFNQFRNRNFTVLGVSLDRPGQKNKWIEAIKEDNLSWTHVSDLKFWNSSVVPLYGIDGIPFNVLVDPGGMVIAEDLKGPVLEAKLEEVLK